VASSLFSFERNPDAPNYQDSISTSWNVSKKRLLRGTKA
jgi:hypothetical protein